jgi:hypothetical protein
MTEEELARFKSYPKSKLIEYVSGDKPTSPYHIAAKYELDRRASVRDALIDRILSRKRDCHIHNRAGDPLSFPFTMKRAT